jgi:hypothetical protein
MANKIYIDPESTLKINGEAGADYAWSMEGLATANGRVSARIDLGAAPRSKEYEWICVAAWQASPTQGKTLDLYIAEWGQSTTTPGESAGDVGASDAALGDVDQRRNLGPPIGSVTAEDAATTKMVSTGRFRTTSRYISLVGYNDGGATLNATDSNFEFYLTPVPDEVQ